MSDTFRFPTAEEITRDWGERCPSFDQDCGCCQMWATYDLITTLQADNALLVEERDRLRECVPAPQAHVVSSEAVEIARLTYLAKVKEYERDFMRDDKPDGFWMEKYGTNLHATYLGEQWAMRAALEAAIRALAPQMTEATR